MLSPRDRTRREFLTSSALGLGGVALAVSLGARDYIANLISGHTLQQTYRVGQRIRVGGFEGQILELTPTALVLQTAEGRTTLPAKMFVGEPVVLVAGNESDA